jgi:Fe-S cluster biogenesis protein NfuA
MNEETEDRNPPPGIGRIEELIRAVEGSADPAARDHVRELARAILGLHEAGLRRMVELIARAGEPGAEIMDACARDELVGSLLLLHDLHPQPPEARVQQVLAQLRPLLHQHGADLEVVGVAEGLVRLMAAGGGRGMPPTPALRRLVEGAVREAVPDVERVEFEDPSPHVVRSPLGMIPLPVLGQMHGPCRGGRTHEGAGERAQAASRPPAGCERGVDP